MYILHLPKIQLLFLTFLLPFVSFQLFSPFPNREVPEWLKGPAWKAGIGATLSRVRIPSSLLSIKNQRIALVFLFMCDCENYLFCNNVAFRVYLHILKHRKMKMTYKILPILALALYSCEPVDPTDPNEEELITTFTVDLVGPTSSATLSYVDLDGDGGSAPVISVDSLESNTEYTGSLTLLNESVSPAEDITTEVFDEADDHQFFFYSSGESTFTYSDQDNDGNPLGLEFELTTGSSGSEDYTITLRHEPVKTAAGVSDGDITNAGGETDIEVVFEIDIK